MNPEKKTFLIWLGYSRRERRSTLILLIILILILAFPYLLPEKQSDFKDISGLLIEDFSSGSSSLFNFDPNSSSFDTLISLGLDQKQAKTIINYRNKGGKFTQPGDIKKIYGLDESSAARLLPFVVIKRDSGNNLKNSKNLVLQKVKKVRFEINQADSAKFDALPGIGGVLSARIIKYKKLLGGFVSVEQLKEVYGLPESTYLNIRDRVYADSSLIRFINLNDTSLSKLSRHPYLDKFDIMAILKYRELNGRVTGVEELIANKILTELKAKKISPYLKF